MAPRERRATEAVEACGARGAAPGLVLLCVLAATSLAPGVSEAAEPEAPTTTAGAEPTGEELAAARRLFAHGLELERKGAWEQALAIFKTVAAVKMTPQVRFHLALCEENLGRLIAAINGFELAEQEARQMGARAADVQVNAPKRAAALRQRIAGLRIDVAGAPPGARVLLDGNPLAPALLGSEVPVDPGPHTIVVQAGGRALRSDEVTLAEREIKRLAIELHDVALPVDPAATSATRVNPAPRPPAPPPVSPLRGRAPAIVAAGVSVLSLAGAAVFFGLRESAFDEVRGTCAPGTTKDCSPDTKPEFERGKTFTVVTALLGGVGAAGLATAGVLWFALPPTSAGQRTTWLGVTPRIGGAELTVPF